MHNPQNQMGSTCSTCTLSDCPLNEDECDELQTAQNERKIQGWAFSGACALVFILPIFLGILGAMIFHGNPTQSLLGGFVGFLLGWGLSSAITRISKLETGVGSK